MKIAALLVPLTLLSACATVPPDGPSRMALPGTGKQFDQFRYDDSVCRQFGFEQSGSVKESAKESAVTSAAVGTVVGGLLGAAVGGHQGAAVGAGSGLLVGTVAGADAASSSYYTAQQRYDNAYTQCMYAKGHKVAVAASLANTYQQGGNVNRNTSAPLPPPPPGYQGAPLSAAVVPPDYRE
ncbi:YMGG-like glycine zipper-containing protein [Methylobacillus arboreus]|uniref:YMGG-like glycine zipper-containing protein n=1 Tax=Methylobacillus arboreus TaxID=755170 RepID=UPI001E4C89A6|nr:YMGG-like glycine zipper-containing protein [Methylobacillus arboreus]MCB5190810.1 YMGG-like glycine zipper-containing protein [Methylobacillus arboreus]